jgi:hypothetical protein
MHMARAKSWHGKAETPVEIVADDGAFFFARQDQELSPNLVGAICKDAPGWLAVSRPLELVVCWTFSGYYDPGRSYGPPERCYPPEYEDEREICGVALYRFNPQTQQPEAAALSESTLTLLLSEHPWLHLMIRQQELPESDKELHHEE